MKKVLTIDDSKVIRLAIAQHLRPFTCQVLEATDGQEGVNIAKRDRPDLILLDVSMPVMDGRQALALLRADAATQSIPVIMLTGESSEDLVLDIARLGVQGYIVKPFAPQRFEQAVAKVLGPPDAGLRRREAEIVLVVDDSERLVEQARTLLGPSRKVVTALSGAAAISLYVDSRPAVIVIDLAMPDMDGFATLAAIKSRGGADGYFIALTVRGDQAAREQALAAGFASVVEKPFQGSALADAVAARPAGHSAGPVTIVDDCPIVTMPAVGGETFEQFKPQEIVRALAEDGHDRLILDLTQHRQLHADVGTAIVSLLGGATGMGLRVAIVASSPEVVAGLKALPEASAVTCVDSVTAARQQLG